jgi:polyketide cyclase/dehydrase/lipid transport protein
MRIAVAVVLMSMGLAAAAPPPPPDVNVASRDGLYQVTAMFRVAQPASVAFAVLTDYEQIPRFMPDVRKSQILERREQTVVVDQEAVARLLLFSKRVHLVLEIEETPRESRPGRSTSAMPSPRSRPSRCPNSC